MRLEAKSEELLAFMQVPVGVLCLGRFVGWCVWEASKGPIGII
jgi:hypothetical protein